MVSKNILFSITLKRLRAFFFCLHIIMIFNFCGGKQVVQSAGFYWQGETKSLELRHSFHESDGDPLQGTTNKNQYKSTFQEWVIQGEVLQKKNSSFPWINGQIDGPVFSTEAGIFALRNLNGWQLVNISESTGIISEENIPGVNFLQLLVSPNGKQLVVLLRKSGSGCSLFIRESSGKNQTITINDCPLPVQPKITFTIENTLYLMVETNHYRVDISSGKLVAVNTAPACYERGTSFGFEISDSGRRIYRASEEDPPKIISYPNTKSFRDRTRLVPLTSAGKGCD